MSAALGFGVSGPHGEGWFDDRKLTRLIAQAIDGGVRHFDTAPFYGDAEARLGRALKAIGASDIIVSTKTGTRRAGARSIKDFSADGIRMDIEASLRRLRRDTLDTLYLHGPSPAEIDAALPVLSALKADGKVKAIGVCGMAAGLDHAVLRGVDAIMGVYNIIERRHAAIFAEAKLKGVQTVAIAPIAQGAFAGPRLPKTPSDAWRTARKAMRGELSGAVLARARKELAAAHFPTLSGAALAFVLQDGLADLAFTTTSNPSHLAESLDAARRALGREAMARLSALALDPAVGRS